MRLPQLQVSKSLCTELRKDEALALLVPNACSEWVCDVVCGMQRMTVSLHIIAAYV
jgi:hypothetical protein